MSGFVVLLAMLDQSFHFPLPRPRSGCAVCSGWMASLGFTLDYFLNMKSLHLLFIFLYKVETHIAHSVFAAD